MDFITFHIKPSSQFAELYDLAGSSCSNCTEVVAGCWESLAAFLRFDRLSILSENVTLGIEISFRVKLAMSVNIVTLVGRVGRDPEVRYFESGNVLAKCGLAVNRRSRNNDQPDWFNLEIWGKTAEIAANYVRKGSLIGVTGSLKLDSWQDRSTGALRTTPVIRVTQLDLLGSKRDNESPMGHSDDEF